MGIDPVVVGAGASRMPAWPGGEPCPGRTDRGGHLNSDGASAGTSAADSLERPDLFASLDLERIDRDLFRSTALVDDPRPLYGGLVAAQALLAAGRTVPADRPPHSLHAYYLRPGSAARPMLLRVSRDRDGRSFSSRRVVAVQEGKVVFSMATSFQAPDSDGRDEELAAAPDASVPEEACPLAMPRLTSMECRVVSSSPGGRRPTRFWSRCTRPLPDEPLVHAAVLTYLSDISSGLAALHDDEADSGPSLDHAVWFHRPVRLDDWVLMDLVPRTVAGGRGAYDGTVHSIEGTLVATLSQEALFRTRDRAGPRAG